MRWKIPNEIFFFLFTEDDQDDVDAFWDELENSESDNEGNFDETLNFPIKLGDKNYLQNQQTQKTMRMMRKAKERKQRF